MPRRAFIQSRDYPGEGAVATVAFFSAPILPVTVMAVASPPLGFDLLALLFWAALFYLFMLAFALVFALPAFLAARRFRMVNLWSALVAGGLIGALAAAVIPVGMSAPYYGRAFSHALPLYAALGASSGAIFWVFLGCGRRLIGRASHGL